MVSGHAVNTSGSAVGVAISFTEIVAVDSRVTSAQWPDQRTDVAGRAGARGNAVASVNARTGEWRMPLDAPNHELASWPSLVAALRTLKTLIGETGGTLAVALLSPVSETRKLDGLPRLPDDQLETLVARSAARYFVGARGAQLATVSARGKRADSGVVASSVPAWVVRLVTAAAHDAGWTLLKLVPGEAAWTVAANKTWPRAGKDAATVLVHQPARTDVLQLNDGELVNVRRMRSATGDVAALIESLPPESARFAFGEHLNDSAATAAAFVADVRTMLFRTDEMRHADRSRRNRLLATLLGVSALLLIASALLSYWDVKRELVAVQAARASIKPQLASTMVGRTSVETVSGQLQMLATTERESPHWSTVLAELTENLPDDSYLTSLRGRSDTVLFEGMAEHAALVFPALERVQSFTGVKAAAAVRREAGESGEALERFTLAARLRSAPPVANTKTSAAARTAGGAP